MFITAS